MSYSKASNKKNCKSSIPMIVTKNTIPFGGSTVSIIVQRPTSLKSVTKLAMSDADPETYKICLVAQKSKDDINDVYSFAKLATVNNITFFHTNIQLDNDSQKNTSSQNDITQDSKVRSDDDLQENRKIHIQSNLNGNLDTKSIDEIDYSNMIAKITVTCEEKVKIKSVRNVSGYQELCEYEIIEDVIDNEDELKKVVTALQNEFNRYLQVLETRHAHQKEKLEKIRKTASGQSNLSRKINIIAAFIYNDDPSSAEEVEDEEVTFNRLSKGQKVLEETLLSKKAQMIIDEIKYKLAEISIEKAINSQTEEELKKDYQKAILRKKMEIIRKRLGDSSENVIEKFRKMLDYIKEPEEKERIAVEITKLRAMPYSSAESVGIINFLELAYKIFVKPTANTTLNSFDPYEVRKRLDKHHYGMHKVKSNVIAHWASLAYANLNAKNNAKILCLIGPPGVGKTTVAISIAQANNWNYCVIPMGGVKDEAELRGHRRTYVGALPGKIVSSVAKMPTKDGGVIILDEVDKLGSPEVAAALLELLDPNQNKNFTDHYFGRIDLSKYIFILTANYIDRMPEALLDRTEKLILSGYSLKEKINIVEKYIIPDLSNGFNLHFCNIPDCEGTALEDVGMNSIDELVDASESADDNSTLDNEETLDLDEETSGALDEEDTSGALDASDTPDTPDTPDTRSEERRVGKECW